MQTNSLTPLDQNSDPQETYKTVDAAILNATFKFLAVHETPKYQKITEAYENGDLDNIRNETLSLANELIAEYRAHKDNLECPSAIFQKFNNCFLYYEMNYGTDRWLVEFVLLPIISELCLYASDSVRIIENGVIYKMLYNLTLLTDESDFDFVLPKLLHFRFEAVSMSSPDLKPTSIDVLNFLIMGEKQNRLKKYFNNGGKISSCYLQRGDEINFPPSMNGSSSYAAFCILYNLNVTKKFTISDTAFGFESLRDARNKVRYWLRNFRAGHTESTSSIYGLTKNKFINKKMGLLTTLLAISSSETIDFINICNDPDDAAWHNVFSKYTDPSNYFVNTNMITQDNFELVAAIIYQNMFLLSKIEIVDSLCLRETLKHILLDVMPLLHTFKDSTQMTHLYFANASIVLKDTFALYLDTSEESIIKELQAEILSILNPCSHGAIFRPDVDWRCGILPAAVRFKTQ